MLGDDHELTWSLLRTFVNTCNFLGQYKDTIDLVEYRVDAVLVSLPPVFDRNKISVLKQLAAAYRLCGRLQDSLVLMELLLNKSTAEEERDDVTILDIRINIAEIHFELGRREEAIKLCEDTYHRMRTIEGEDSLYVMYAEAKLVRMYTKIGRSGEALELAQGNLYKSRKLLGQDHNDTLICQVGLGNIHGDLGQPELGISLVNEAIRIGRESGCSNSLIKWMLRKLRRLRADEDLLLMEPAVEEAEVMEGPLIVQTRKPNGLKRWLKSK